MNLTVVVILFAIVNMGLTDMIRLRKWPKGMDNYDFQKSLGRWYLYAAAHPCTWNGAYAFTDWTITFNQDQHGFTVEEKWRKDRSCTTTHSKVTSTTSSAAFKAMDQIGDIWSGTLVVVCTDYDNYGITWGCVKESVHPGMCDDYMFYVRTRKPKPSRKIVDEINQKLQQLWSISLSDTGLVSHNAPCDQPIGRPGRMFKTY